MFTKQKENQIKKAEELVNSITNNQHGFEYADVINRTSDIKDNEFENVVQNSYGFIYSSVEDFITDCDISHYNCEEKEGKEEYYNFLDDPDISIIEQGKTYHIVNWRENVLIAKKFCEEDYKIQIHVENGRWIF